MRKKVNATRHALLKDKLEGLIKELTEHLDEYKALRLKVDERWPRVFQRFALADAEASAEATETAVSQARPRVKLTASVVRVMGVPVTRAEAEVLPGEGRYSLIQTSPHLDVALRELKELLPDIIKLAGLEQAVRAISAEIQKTRRRANALEYILIPDLRDARKQISSRLEEIARSDISRLMKVKEMLLEREAAA